jgi:hypothetical protein
MKPPPLPPTCAGHYRTGAPCARPAEAGSRYCWQHVEQRPAEPLPYLVETRSALSRSRAPLVHLRYVEARWVLCTRSPARDVSGPALAARVCGRCRDLAVAAVQRGELEPDTLRRFTLGEPNVDEARS